MLRPCHATGAALLAGAALLVYKRHRAARLADSKVDPAGTGKCLTSISSSGGKLTAATTTMGISKLTWGLSTIKEGTQGGSSAASPNAGWR